MKLTGETVENAVFISDRRAFGKGKRLDMGGSVYAILELDNVAAASSNFASHRRGQDRQGDKSELCKCSEEMHRNKLLKPRLGVKDTEQAEEKDENSLTFMQAA